MKKHEQGNTLLKCLIAEHETTVLISYGVKSWVKNVLGTGTPNIWPYKNSQKVAMNNRVILHNT